MSRNRLPTVGTRVRLHFIWLGFGFGFWFWFCTHVGTTMFNVWILDARLKLRCLY